MSYESREIKCADCGEMFEFTAEEQEFYASKGFSEPKRCPKCRTARKNMRNNNNRQRFSGNRY